MYKNILKNSPNFSDVNSINTKLWYTTMTPELPKYFVICNYYKFQFKQYISYQVIWDKNCHVNNKNMVIV